MLKKTAEWLLLAMGHNIRRIHILDESGFVTDGFRLHLTNREELPEEISDITLSSSFRKFEGNIQASVVCNPQYLVDALSGFKGKVEIRFIKSDYDNGLEILHLFEGNSENEAYIACIEKKDDDNEIC